jgi:hypothetical protein
MRLRSVTRVSSVVYAALSLLGVAAASAAKGYLDTTGEFAFVVLVSAAALVVAHFWSTVMAHRMVTDAALSRQWWWHEVAVSSVMFVPGLLMAGLAWLAFFLTEDFETSVTSAMLGLLIGLFGFTWVAGLNEPGSRWAPLWWALGTTVVGGLMIVFKLVA